MRDSHAPRTLGLETSALLRRAEPNHRACGALGVPVNLTIIEKEDKHYVSATIHPIHSEASHADEDDARKQHPYSDKIGHGQS